MYGKPRESSVNVVRGKLLKDMVGEDVTLSSKSNVDMVRLPRSMSSMSLIPHIRRVNHHVGPSLLQTCRPSNY